MKTAFRDVTIAGTTHPGLPDLPVPGARVSIRLDAKERLVFAWRDFEDPPTATILLGFVESNTATESLEDWVSLQREFLSGLCELMDGSDQDLVEDLQNQVMQSLMRAEADTLCRWLTPEDWFRRKGRSDLQIADEAISIGDIDALVEIELAAALSENVYLDSGGMKTRVRQIVLDERSEIECDWPEDDPSHLHTRDELHRRLHQLRLLLGETHPQPEPTWEDFDLGVDLHTFQRRLVHGIRSVTSEDVTRVRMALRGLDIERPLDIYPLHALLASMCKDAPLRLALCDAIAQVQQADILEDYLKKK